MTAKMREKGAGQLVKDMMGFGPGKCLLYEHWTSTWEHLTVETAVFLFIIYIDIDYIDTETHIHSKPKSWYIIILLLFMMLYIMLIYFSVFPHWDFILPAIRPHVGSGFVM